MEKAINKQKKTKQTTDKLKIYAVQCSLVKMEDREETRTARFVIDPDTGRLV